MLKIEVGGKIVPPILQIFSLKIDPFIDVFPKKAAVTSPYIGPSDVFSKNLTYGRSFVLNVEILGEKLRLTSKTTVSQQFFQTTAKIVQKRNFFCLFGEAIAMFVMRWGVSSGN